MLLNWTRYQLIKLRITCDTWMVDLGGGGAICRIFEIGFGAMIDFSYSRCMHRRDLKM